MPFSFISFSFILTYWHYIAYYDVVRKPAMAYREQRDRELAYRNSQVLSRKERTDTKRQQTPRAAGIATQTSGTCSALGQWWSAFKSSLDVKVRIVMYRVAPFFTLREYYLSPWYERSRRKAEEASWTVAWQQMNQPAALQGAKAISTYDTTPSHTHTARSTATIPLLSTHTVTLLSQPSVFANKVVLLLNKYHKNNDYHQYLLGSLTMRH